MKPGRFGVYFILAPLVTGALFGQVDRGAIGGRVTDSSQAVLPGVHVLAVNLETGVQAEALTNDLGLYTLPGIAAGRYKVSFSLEGFKTFEHTGVSVTVAESVRLDATLQVGEISEVVNVSGTATLLNKENALLATTIQSEVVTDLPLSFFQGRFVENFAFALTPAVEGNSWTSYIAGGAAFTKEVFIDGISATAQIQGHLAEAGPSMEAVQEFKAQTSGLSAEYGRTSGGVFNFSLKSGSNDFHGSAFYYARNEALNANTWINNWRLAQSPGDPRLKRALDRQSLGGMSAGGPVVIPRIHDGRNKTFLFGAFERYLQEDLRLGPMNSTVPIPEFLAGDFSRLLTTTRVATDALGRPVYAGQIYDPRTMRQVGGRWVAEPFLGNIIPPGRLSSLSSKIIDLYRKHYPPMISGPLTNNSARPSSNPWYHLTQLTVKGDHTLSPGHKISGSLIWADRPRILVDPGIWDPQDRTKTGGPLARSRSNDALNRSARVSYDWTVKPGLVNFASIAYNRSNYESLATQAKGDWGKRLGLENSTSAGHFPWITFGPPVNGIGTTTIGHVQAGSLITNVWVLRDTVGWIKGRHNLKLGGEFHQMPLNSGLAKDTLRFHFSPATTGIPGEPWSNRVGFGFASFFLGEVNEAGKNVPFSIYGRRSYVAFFAQDDVKLSGRLTLNLGLRWEQTQPLREKYGHWSNFNPGIVNTKYNLKGALAFLAGPGDSFERKKDWKEFSPRLGLAYQLGNKAVVRGGYGIFYSPIGLNYWCGVPYCFAPGYRGENRISPSGNRPRFNWDQGYPDAYQPPTKDPTFLVWGMVAVDEKSLFLGYTHQYNLSFQYQLSNDMIVETAFLGNQGRRLHNGSLRRNQPTRAAYEDSSVNPFAWVSDAPSAKRAGVPYPYPGFAGFAGMALQPFPHVAAETWGPLLWVGSPLGVSGYKSFQLSLVRRLSKGWAGQVSYNLSRARGNVETGFDETWNEAGNIQDMYDSKRDAKTVLPYDQTHVFKGFLSFELPFGRGRKFLSSAPALLDVLLGGWRVTTIFRYNSGVPLSIAPNVYRPGWEGTIYADVAGNPDFRRKFDGRKFNPGKQNDPGNLYFDPATFSNPTGHQLGNGKRLYSELRGFGFGGEDIGIMKYFRYGESVSIQIRAELLNAFNRHYFENPGNLLGNKMTFGHVISTSGSPRAIQVGLRVGW